jgi:DNA polymerase/3'-5' exonuclease PolX
MVSPPAGVQKAPKQKFPRAAALDVARALCEALKPCTERLIVAGSLRRRKPEVGDVEILYVARSGMLTPPGEIFARMCNLVDEEISRLESAGVLERRRNVNGSEMFGPRNKLMIHKTTGLPVDLFAASPENWWNYLVCRTGPADSNTRICMAAQQRGWKWNPYGSGFSRGGPLAGEPETYEVESEEDVFRFVGLPYAEPWERA